MSGPAGGFGARAAAGAVAALAFELGGELHACDVLLVQEVVHRARVHALPDMPPRLLGLLRLRGELVPVVDVASLLELDGRGGAAGGGPGAVIVVEAGAGRVGVAADGVREVLELPAGAFRPAPLTGRERDAFVVGVARVDGQLVNLIDLAEMLRDPTTLGRGEPL